ncbi:MAG: hypothetical protein ACFNKE_08795, partial [Neisseria elongata]
GHAACWRSKHNRATGAVLSLDDKGGYGLMQVFQTASSATAGDMPFCTSAEKPPINDTPMAFAALS